MPYYVGFAEALFCLLAIIYLMRNEKKKTANSEQTGRKSKLIVLYVILVLFFLVAIGYRGYYLHLNMNEFLDSRQMIYSIY